MLSFLQPPYYLPGRVSFKISLAKLNCMYQKCATYTYYFLSHAFSPMLLVLPLRYPSKKKSQHSFRLYIILNCTIWSAFNRKAGLLSYRLISFYPRIISTSWKAIQLHTWLLRPHWYVKTCHIPSLQTILSPEHFPQHSMVRLWAPTSLSAHFYPVHFIFYHTAPSETNHYMTLLNCPLVFTISTVVFSCLLTFTVSWDTVQISCLYFSPFLDLSSIQRSKFQPIHWL